MGIKSINIFNKNLCLKILILFVLLFSLFGLKSLAQDVNINLSDNLKLIRVAISDNSFKSFVYSQIDIISTEEFTLYDKATGGIIARFLPTDVVKIKISSGKFTISANGRTIEKNLKGTLIFDSQYGLLGIESLKRRGERALYNGTFEIIPKNDSQFYLINVVDLQSYLKGVVPNEMPVGFGLEALKAQAVAARNYVLMPRTKFYDEFDVDDSVASQVYFGANTQKSLSDKAVDETEGLVILHNWDLILAQYCSTAGGYTESFENAFSDTKTKGFPSCPKPYLKGRPDICSVCPLNREEEARLFYMSYPDSYDIRSPYYRWQRNFSVSELEEILVKTLPKQSKTGFIRPEFKKEDVLGELKEIRVNKRGVSGKAMEVEVITNKNVWSISKELVIRRVFQKNGNSLPSANIVFDNLYDKDNKLNEVIIYGGGFGHGVGMSQYGAGFMATSLHKSFDEILKRYYTDITISTVPVILSAEDGQKTASIQFFTTKKNAVLVIDNKYNIKEFSANINGRDVLFELTSIMMPFNRFKRIDLSDYVKKGKNNITIYFPENDKNKAMRIYIELFEKDESNQE